MATGVQKAPEKTFYFSLRQYDPDQVIRVRSQPAILQTPLKFNAKIVKYSDILNFQNKIEAKNELISLL